MENNAQGPSRNGGRPDWFLTWLREVFLLASEDPVTSQIQQFQDAVEQIPDLDDSVKKSLTGTLAVEAKISKAREDDKSKVSKLLKSQTLPADEICTPMPWDKLSESKAKLISRTIDY